jgi:hypothetical protein
MNNPKLSWMLALVAAFGAAWVVGSRGAKDGPAQTRDGDEPGRDSPLPASNSLRTGADVSKLEAAVFASAATEARLVALEQRLGALATQERPEKPAYTASIESPPDPAQARRDAAQAHRRLLERHAAEGVDPSWSRQASTMLSADLKGGVGANTNKFSIGAVDCRTTSCTAQIEWPSYGDAVQSLQAVFQRPISMNCTQQVTLADEPADVTLPYRTTAFFDCEESRAAP